MNTDFSTFKIDTSSPELLGKMIQDVFTSHWKRTSELRIYRHSGGFCIQQKWISAIGQEKWEALPEVIEPTPPPVEKMSRWERFWQFLMPMGKDDMP